MIKLDGNSLYVAQTAENQRRIVFRLGLIRVQPQQALPTGNS